MKLSPTHHLFEDVLDWYFLWVIEDIQTIVSESVTIHNRRQNKTNPRLSIMSGELWDTFPWFLCLYDNQDDSGDTVFSLPWCITHYLIKKNVCETLYFQKKMREPQKLFCLKPQQWHIYPRELVKRKFMLNKELSILDMKSCLIKLIKTSLTTSMRLCTNIHMSKYSLKFLTTDRDLTNLKR